MEKETKRTSRKTSQKTSSKAKSKASAALDAQARRDLIARTAYFIAETQGFRPGAELDNWLEAERQVDAGQR